MYIKKLQNTLQENAGFYISFVVIWLLALSYQLSYTQFELSVWVNNWHSPFGDLVMEWLTNAGDGLFLTFIGLILIYFERKNWLGIILCLTLPSLVTQLLKHVVFEDHLRPVIRMEHIQDMYYVLGVNMARFNSFPSGHTTAAFSLYPLLALLLKNKKIGFIWVIIPAMIGISRVYLLQHFWVDVLVGAMIGTVMCTLIFTAFYKEEKYHGD